MTGKSYYGYPGWVDSPLARHVHDQQQQSKTRYQDHARRGNAMTRELNWAKGKPTSIPVASGDSDSDGDDERSGGFLGGLVKFVFWACVIGAILHLVPHG
jgi:hypothetical protein